MLAGQDAQYTAGRGNFHHPVRGHEAERRAVRLRDVRGRLEEPLEHVPRVELQGDLLAEPPHAVQHALRVVELQGALYHAPLEGGLGLPLHRHLRLQLLRRPPLGAQRVVAVEREHRGERRELWHDG